MSRFNCRGRVLFPNNGQIILEFAIDAREVVREAVFEQIGTKFNTDVLDFFCQWIGNRKIDDGVNFFHGKKEVAYLILFEAYQQALKEFKGFAPNLASQLNLQPSQMVCRCFPVDTQQIEKALKLKDVAANDLAIELKASLGCGSCREDFFNIVNSQRTQVKLKKLGGSSRDISVVHCQGKEIVLDGPKDQGLRTKTLEVLTSSFSDQLNFSFK